MSKDKKFRQGAEQIYESFKLLEPTFEVIKKK